MSGKKKAVAPPPALPCTGVDSHAHLNFPDFQENFAGVMERARCAGVKEIGQVFLSPQALAEGRGLFDAYPQVFFLLGIHPTDAHEHEIGVLEEIGRCLQDEPRIKAIGEIGLDYYWKDCPPETQQLFFRKQLELAKEKNLPVVIHCREAEDDTLAILMEHGMRGRPLLWHCFGGSAGFARTILDAGWHISVPGTVTFPKNNLLREAVSIIPADRLLVETDCPFLAPVPMRGKRNEPGLLGYTIGAMAEARGESVEELWTTCGDNARRFFGFSAP